MKSYGIRNFQFSHVVRRQACLLSQAALSCKTKLEHEKIKFGKLPIKGDRSGDLREIR